jgi:hypothetical protein
LGLLATLYFTACIGLIALDNRRLFPGKATQGKSYTVVKPSPEYELVHFPTADGIRIVAQFVAVALPGCASLFRLPENTPRHRPA